MSAAWLREIGATAVEDMDERTARVARVVARELMGWWNDITPSLAREEPDADEWTQARRIAAALIAEGLVPKEDQ